jgi:hypothetical protein
MFQKLFASTLALLFSATASLAVVYECQVTSKERTGWLPKVVVIDYDTDTREVTVFDPIIKHFLGGPTDAEVDLENEKRTTFKWVVDGTTNRLAQFAKMSYRATVFRGSNKFVISGKPLGYLNNYRGTGHCISK